MIGVEFINIRVHNLIAVLGQVDKHTRASQRKSHQFFVVAKLLCLTLFRCCDSGWRQRLESMFDFTCALVLLFSSSSNAFIIRKARPGRKARKAGRPEGRKAGRPGHMSPSPRVQPWLCRPDRTGEHWPGSLYWHTEHPALAVTVGRPVPKLEDPARAPGQPPVLHSDQRRL